MWTLTIIFILSTIFLILCYVPVRNIPGPWGLPILGHLLMLDSKFPHKSLTKLARKYGRKHGLYFLRLGQVKTVVLSDPKLIRHALSKDELSGRAPLYLTHGIMHGYGLVCSEGELWREQRRFVISCLKSLGMIKLGDRRTVLAKKIQKAALRCVKMLEEDIVGNISKSIDPLPSLSHSLGNVINGLVFGREYSRDDKTWRWLQHVQEEGLKHIGIAGPLNFFPWLRLIPYYKRTMDFLIDGKDKSHAIYREILMEHIKKSTVNGHVAGAYLMEMGRRAPGEEASFTEAQCMHALADLFGAGVDTTLASLRWFLLFLAVHPTVQEHVQVELDAAVFARDSSVPELCDLPMCPYTEAAIAETQRLRPVVPVGIPHGAVQECELAGFRIEKGTMIVPLQWAVHTDPELWGPNSFEFQPERFLTVEGRCSRPDFLIPFQTGKRTCLGEELGHMLLFIFGAAIVHKFNISLAAETDVEDVLEGECGITLIPKAHKFVFEPRY